MPNPLVRARWLALALPLALAACTQQEAQARLEAQAAAVDPPTLWRVQALASDGAVTGEILVCADASMRTGFDRANAEVDGVPCVSPRAGVERPGVYANRCLLNGRPFGLTLNRSGDPARDFTVAFALRPLDGSDAASRQVRRFRRVGGCPAGWRVGDQAHPGGRPGVNALAGTWDGR